MTDVNVKMKDGRTLLFEDKGAPGGSYCNEVKHDGAFAVIKDPYGKRTAIPAADIEELVHEASARSHF